MPSNLRRRSLRLFLGANRKLETFRWIGGQTVGVCQLFRAPCLSAVHRQKPEEGAERSFPLRHGKRVRGQRRGRPRSRGDKPRSNSAPSARLPKGVSARVVNHKGRKFLWAERKRSNLVKSSFFDFLVRSCRGYHLDDAHDRTLFLRDRLGDPKWEGWTAHVRSLRRHARNAGIPEGANPFQKSALDFIATNTPLGGEVGFLDILAGLRLGVAPSDIEGFHDSEMRRDEEELSPAEELPSSSKRREPVPVTARPLKKTRGKRQRRVLTTEDGEPLDSSGALKEVQRVRALFSNLKRDA